MPQVTYGATGFPTGSGARLSGTHVLTFSWAELVWAAITVGRAGMRQVLQFGVFSTFEIVYRAALIYANLRQTATGDLGRSDAYDGLDPSEKSAISYFLGLTLSKLFAEQCLKVLWLLHLDVYRSQLNAVLKEGRSKPDLVGQDARGRWVVIESKGRTNGLDQNALEKAKRQSSRVLTISGQAPRFRMGVQAYFESSVLRLAIDDPEQDQKQKPLPDIPITREMVREEYYRPFTAWVEGPGSTEERHVGNRRFIVRAAPELDFVVGLDVAYSRHRFERGPTAHEESLSGLTPSTFIGDDGVLVQLGPRWAESVMKQAPEGRSAE
jgi:hypothetical protein